MRTNQPHTFASGDIIGQPTLANTAGHKNGLFPLTASGRAIGNRRDEGLTKLLLGNLGNAQGHGNILSGGICKKLG